MKLNLIKRIIYIGVIQLLLISCKKADTIFVHSIEFVKVPAGDYFVSSNDIEKSKIKNKKFIFFNALERNVPYNEISISRPFYISKFELTNEQYCALETNLKVDKISAKNPFVITDWSNIESFIRKFNLNDKYTVDIPFEYEWEIAYLFKNKLHSFYWGETKTKENMALYAWTSDNTKELMPVGLKLPNSLGLYDLIGNAKEICRNNSGFCIKGGLGIDPQGPFPIEFFMLPFVSYEIKAEEIKIKKNLGIRLILWDKNSNVDRFIYKK